MEQEKSSRTVWIVIGILVGALLVCSVSGLIGGAIGYAIGAKAQRPCERYEHWDREPWQDRDDWSPRMPDMPVIPQVPDQPELPDWPEMPALPERVQPFVQQFGALVIEVEPKSPADKAGLEVNDTILAVNGQRLPENGSLKESLAQYRAGDHVELMVMRGDEQLWVSVELGRQAKSPGGGPYLGIVYRVIPLGVRPDGRD